MPAALLATNQYICLRTQNVPVPGLWLASVFYDLAGMLRCVHAYALL